jgi:DNA-binding MarR family transcriptional regulator
MVFMDKDKSESPFPIDLGYLGRDFPFMLRSIRGYVHAVTAQTFAGLETEPGDIAILNLVAINPGLSQNDLAAMLVMTKPAVTKAVNSLEKRGLITRRKGEDRRFNAITLTPSGETRVGLFRERMAAQHRLIFEGFSEGEETVFFERLRRILARLYELDRDDRSGRRG